MAQPVKKSSMTFKKADAASLHDATDEEMHDKGLTIATPDHEIILLCPTMQERDILVEVLQRYCMGIAAPIGAGGLVQGQDTLVSAGESDAI
jgi:hypothetical protein